MNLNPGRPLRNCIGIVSTGGPISPEREALGLQTIDKLGYKYLQPFSSSKYYADYSFGFSNGSPDMRIDAINKCLDHSEVDCILAARGATGSFEIIRDLPYLKWKDSRKLLIGCSDVASLLLQLPFRYGIPSIHSVTLGASFADFYSDEQAKESVNSLLKMLSDKNYRQFYECQSISKYTSATEGVLLAGNLTMLCSLLGTPFDVDYRNAILILEEVGEAPYRIKRLLEQMYFAGKFDDLAALCFGRFSKCDSSNGPGVGVVIDNFCATNLADKNYPILQGLEVGHWGKSLPIPIGCRAIVNDTGINQVESPLGN